MTEEIPMEDNIISMSGNGYRMMARFRGIDSEGRKKMIVNKFSPIPLKQAT